MVGYNDIKIGAVAFGKTAISYIYYGAVLAWTAIRSCFGSGVWRGDKPWKGEDKWKSFNS